MNGILLNSLPVTSQGDVVGIIKLETEALPLFQERVIPTVAPACPVVQTISA